MFEVKSQACEASSFKKIMICHFILFHLIWIAILPFLLNVLVLREDPRHSIGIPTQFKRTLSKASKPKKCANKTSETRSTNALKEILNAL